MADTKEEAQWRATFETEGETAIRDAMNFRSVPYPEPMRQFAFKWLREQARRTAEKNAEEAAMQSSTLRWARIAGWTGIVGVIVGLAAIAVSIMLAR